MSALPLRRSLGPALLLLLAVVAWLPAPAAPRAQAAVSVRRDGSLYHVEAKLRAPVAVAVAWEVLTDFEHMERFVPNVVDSHIIARDGDRLTILQHGVARFGPITVPFESERVVTLVPKTRVTSTQVRGNMRRLDSVTTFKPDGDGTELDYKVDVVPGLAYPAILVERFIADEIAEQFEAIVAEMIRRQPR
jgi:carbon monoxide dehydrogenase subunit G